MPASLRLADRYSLLEPLAQGGQASVSLGRDELRGLEVVIKEVPARSAAVLRHEFSLLSRLHHPNVVEVLDLVEHQGRTYLVQTRAPGPDFVTWASHGLSCARICEGAAAVLRALSYVHSRGIVHRDLQPENIRVDEGEIARLPAARLIDFGLAAYAPPGEVVGTLAYAAPEVLAGEPATPASDLYSLGAVLFEGLMGRLPRRELGRLVEETAPLAAALGPVLPELIGSLLQASPADRPDARAAMEALSVVAARELAPTLEDLQGPLLPQPSLVGREAARARLLSALQEAQRGAAVLLQLSGCGKSTLLREADLAARSAGFSTRLLGSTAELLTLAELSPRNGAGVVAAGDLIHRAIDALVQREGHWLLGLDHLDSESHTLDLLGELGRALEGSHHAGWVVLYAGDVPERPPPGWTLVALEPLDREQTAELVREMLHSLPSPLWLDQVFPATGGDPRLIVELVYAQLAAGLPDALTAFSGRSESVAQRVVALSAEEKRLLALICATIRPLPFTMIEELWPGRVRALSALLRKGLVRAEPGGFLPASRAAQAAAAQLCTEQDGRALHARLAQAWQVRSPSALDVLGHHRLLAGEVRAGAEALLRSSSPRLADLVRAVDELPMDDPLWPDAVRRLARLTRASGDLPGALQIAARLAAHHREEAAQLEAEILLDSGQPARALEALAQVEAETAASCLLAARARFFLGEHQQALEQALRGCSAPQLSREVETRLQSLTGLASVYTGRLSEGLAALDRARALAEELADQESLIRVLSARGIALQRLGQLDQARSAYSDCAALARERGDLRAASSSTMNLGTLAHQQLALGEARAAYRRAEELARRAGIGTTQVTALSNEANLLLLLGALPEASERLERAERVAEACGAAAELSYIQLYRAELRLMNRDLEAARVAAQAARSSFEAGDASGLDAADLVLGEILLAQQREPGVVSDFAAELLARIDRDSPQRWRAHLLAAKAALHAGAPDYSRAGIQLELALALASAQGARLLAWEASALLARCAAQLGRADEAAFHARRFAATVQELRGLVPPAYRASFDSRPDLVQARASLPEDDLTGRATSPSSKDYQRLLALNAEINQCLPVDELLGRILDCAIELTGAERGFVLLGEGDRLALAAARNVDGEALRRGMERISQTIARTAIEQGEPVVVADAMGDSRFYERLSIAGLRLRAVLCVPLRTRDETVGALYVDNRFRTDAFTPRHVQLMESFAHQVGIALRNARLLEELGARTRELERTRDQVEAQSRELEAQVVAQRQELTEITVRLHANEEELIRKYNAGRIIGRSKAMRALFASLDRLTEAEVPVLLWGESGTGKELVARAIHAFSARREQPFVCINCGAVAPTLLESELFGHVRGAFTGAMRDRPGLFEAAGSGTLLLDEVGDMPPEMQVKLLRILQEGTFRRVGEDRERQSRCRVISASHKRLDQLVQAGRFREDLYYRLQVIQLEVPALRDRREDIPLLAEHVLSSLQRPVTVSPAAMAALLDYDWPGNVRQLENELQRAALLCDSVIEPAHLSIPVSSRRARRKQGLREELRQHEKELIREALAEAGGQVSQAAEALGLHRVVLYRRMRELGLPPPKDKAAPRRKRSREP